MIQTMATVTKLKMVIIASVVKCISHGFVCQRPVAKWSVSIVLIACEEDSNSPARLTSEHGGIVVSAPDIGE